MGSSGCPVRLGGPQCLGNTETHDSSPHIGDIRINLIGRQILKMETTLLHNVGVMRELHGLL
jgi:hypothetical protein